jgi:hypothetical protein
MHFGRFPRKTLLAATLLLAFSSANASFVEQIGTPATPLAVMGTYAADAAIKPGLKAVIPPGWQLFHHQSVELPTGLSWEKDDTWVSVLNKFASKHDIAVLIDWDKKQVYFRSTTMALKEQEKRQMITQAASTPLPAFKGPESKAVVAVPTPASTERLVDKPAEKVAEKPAIVVASPAATPTLAAALATRSTATVPAAPIGSPAVQVAVETSSKATPPAAAEAPASLSAAGSTAPAVAVVPAPVPAQPVAAVPTPAIAAVPAVVVPMSAGVAVSPAVATVPRVTGAASPFAVKRPVRPPVKAASPDIGSPAQVLAVKPNPEPTSSVVAIPSVAVGAAAAVPSAPVVAPTLTPATLPARAIAASVTSVPAVAIVPPVAPAPVSVAVVTAAAPAEAPGAVAFNREQVSTVVATAGAKHGYTVSWDAAPVVFPGPVTLLGADMGEDMNLVLRALGGRRAAVEMTVYRSSNVVVVRDAATGSASVTFTDVPFSGRIREISGSKSNGIFAAARVAAPIPAPVRVVASTYVQPVAVHPAPSYVAPVPAAVEPVRVTPEPARLETAVATVKKLEPAQPLVEATARVVTLRVPAGGQLRDAIEASLEQGWTLKWEVKDDLVANTEMSASGESLMAALNQVLPRLKLSADFYKPSKLVIVREADQALDK